MSSLISYRIRIVIYYYITYDETSYKYYKNTLDKIKSPKTSKKTRNDLIDKYSAYQKLESFDNLIYNILIFIAIYGKRFWKFLVKFSQFLVVFFNKNLFKIKSKFLKKSVQNIATFIDLDKRNLSEEKHEEIEDENDNYIEIVTWTIKNFDKNYFLLIQHYPHLKNTWSTEERKFLKVYRIYSFIYESITYPENRLYNDVILYKEE